MKLNLDCVRDVLLQCEKMGYNEHLRLDDLKTSLPKYSEDEIEYTCLKLSEADYLKITTKDLSNQKIILRINDITFKGHEFLNDIRSDNVWESIMNVSKKIGTSSVSGIAKIATGVITQLIVNNLPNLP